MAQTILEYLNKKFGTVLVSRLAKLSEEYQELIDAFHQGSREDFIDELADLNGVLFHIAGLLGISQDELLVMMIDKLKGREKDPDYKRKHPHRKSTFKLRNQVAVLREIEKEYPTSSIGSIITQIESRIKHYEKNN